MENLQNDGTASEEEVMAFADSACYRAKAQGRNRIEVYDVNEALIAELHRQKPRVAEISEALRTRQLEIAFQPVVSLQTGGLVHYEVLVRPRSHGSLLLPGTFLRTAERFHLMPEIDRQVISKALPTLAANQELELAINLSGQSFGDEALPDFIEASFRAANVRPERVIFEITETAVISNMPGAQTMTKQLRAEGFRFALDDFGADFSSFTYLKDLVADYLKIDGSFVRGAGGDHINWIFVEMINDIAHRLNIRSIAEFVEDESMAVALREIGVDLAQGDFFGKPSSSCSFPGLRGPKRSRPRPPGKARRWLDLGFAFTDDRRDPANQMPGRIEASNGRPINIRAGIRPGKAYFFLAGRH